MKKILNFIYRLIGLETEESRLTDSYKQSWTSKRLDDPKEYE